MTPKQISIIAQSLFIREFTFQIIKSIKEQKIYYKTNDTIDADLVPKVVGNKKSSIMEHPKYIEKETKYNPPVFFFRKKYPNIFQIEKRSFNPEYITPATKKIQQQTPEKKQFTPPEFSKIKKPELISHSIIDIQKAPITPPEFSKIKKPEIIKQFTPPEFSHIKKPEMISPKIVSIPKIPITSKELLQTKKPEMITPIIKPQVKTKQKQQIAPIKKSFISSQGQEKINPLLNDSSIYSIECPGAGKPIMVSRRGQIQPTKIILNENEIKDFLKKISDSIHIPLMEGVFRTVIGKISINAVISDIVGSKFIIKKHNI
jgi:hypothetical protein